MPTLHEVQRAMRRSIVDHGDDAVADLLAPDGVPPAESLTLYRGNYAGALIAALRLSYPAIDRLVGAEFFAGAARQFIREMPPRMAWLYDYGGAFADFLAQFPPAAELPYLPDVARLEWAVNGAIHAVDCDGVTMSDLTRLADADPHALSFEPHPAIGLLRVDHPADRIWRAVLAGDEEALGKIDMAEGSSWLLVERGRAGIEVSRLSDAEGRFSAALFAGEPLDRAIEAAGEADMSQILAAHFTNGRIAKIHVEAPQEASA
jgi:hypothetical protein